jgi:hypothetical protein
MHPKSVPLAFLGTSIPTRVNDGNGRFFRHILSKLLELMESLEDV